ncbi:nuclear transport factor 2 family protein [Kutzneria kofuensis]|jgi:hypothetical protein|uniref:SnoaL-like domain-containing protein n=1 Tax=Kutzneria kofuensis TaxID=103725 RepID=A0A7W9NGC7_9PSEU|nr:nuclear transport factor 2 family protein [Kutzneria kofuensis]MBB5890963.1 hypothetical protein [Kutzneria kofuensis]
MRISVKYGAAAVALAAAACLLPGSLSQAAPAQVANQASQWWPSAAERSARSVEARFINRSNALDAAGIAALIAPDAKWDSVGNLFNGRDDIMNRLIIPAVIQTSARYTVIGSHWDGFRLQMDYHFVSKTGDDVLLHYAYLVRNGQIADIVEYID